MAHYAKIEDGTVTDVIVAEQGFIDSLVDSSMWLQTSYNTIAGTHSNNNKTPLRKNFAGVGFTYDSVRDAFIPPQSFPSWILDDTSCEWEAPVAYPNDGTPDKRYTWDEELTNWIETEGVI